MIVEELLSTIGLKVDPAGFIEAESWIGKLKFAFGALVAGLGLNQLREMVKGVAEVADGLSKSAQKTGIGVEALQELGYAAKLSDVSQQGLESSLTKLEKAFGKLEKGKGPAGDALKKLGIDFKTIKDLRVEEKLEVIADAFANMEDGPKKQAAAMELFGRSGLKLIPLLNGGAKGLREAREEAHKLGIVITEETAHAFEEFNDDQTRVSEAWRGMRIQIVTALLPALHELVTGLLEWVKANRDVISGGLEVAGWAIVASLKALAAVISEVVSFGRNLVKFTQDHTGLAIALATVLVAVLVPAIYAWIAASLPALAIWFAMNAPLILIITAITAIVLLVNHWAEIWPVVTKAAAEAWETIKGGLLSLWNWVRDIHIQIIGYIADAFKSLGQTIYDATVNALDRLVTLSREAGRRLWEEFKQGIKDVATSPVTGIWGLIKQTVFNGGDPGAGAGPSDADVQKIRDLQGQAREAQAIIPAGQQMSASFGSVSVTVQSVPGESGADLGQRIADHVARAQRTMLFDAFDTLRGGRR